MMIAEETDLRRRLADAERYAKSLDCICDEAALTSMMLGVAIAAHQLAVGEAIKDILQRFRYLEALEDLEAGDDDVPATSRSLPRAGADATGVTDRTSGGGDRNSERGNLYGSM